MSEYPMVKAARQPLDLRVGDRLFGYGVKTCDLPVVTVARGVVDGRFVFDLSNGVTWSIPTGDHDPIVIAT